MSQVAPGARPVPVPLAGSYAEPMTLSAGEVAAVLRARLPGLATKKLHKLLYYCQGHHLASFDEPLFGDTISAWDMGPVVGALWHQERQESGEPGADHPARVPAPALASGPALDEAQLNTIGYVISRYGALTGRDLEHLTHSEAPWQRANQGRPPRDSARIEPDWIRDHFWAMAAARDDDEAVPEPAALHRWLRHAATRRTGHPRPDRREEIMARLARA